MPCHAHSPRRQLRLDWTTARPLSVAPCHQPPLALCLCLCCCCCLHLRDCCCCHCRHQCLPSFRTFSNLWPLHSLKERSFVASVRMRAVSTWCTSGKTRSKWTIARCRCDEKVVAKRTQNTGRQTHDRLQRVCRSRSRAAIYTVYIISPGGARSKRVSTRVRGDRLERIDRRVCRKLLDGRHLELI